MAFVQYELPAPTIVTRGVGNGRAALVAARSAGLPLRCRAVVAASPEIVC